jgi:hypothetical protein
MKPCHVRALRTCRTTQSSQSQTVAQLQPVTVFKNSPGADAPLSPAISAMALHILCFVLQHMHSYCHIADSPIHTLLLHVSPAVKIADTRLVYKQDTQLLTSTLCATVSGSAVYSTVKAQLDACWFQLAQQYNPQHSVGSDTHTEHLHQRPQHTTLAQKPQATRQKPSCLQGSSASDPVHTEDDAFKACFPSLHTHAHSLLAQTHALKPSLARWCPAQHSCRGLCHANRALCRTQLTL